MTGATTDTLSYPATSNRISNVLTGVTTTRTFTHDGAGNIATDTRSGSTFTYGYNARGRLATVSQDGNLKGTYQYNSLEQLASRAVTNSGAFNGTVHTVQDRSGNVIAEADGTTGVAAKEYIWLPGAGYAGTDLPVGVVDVAGTATPELLYVHADHLGRPIRLTDPAKVTAWAVEWLPWGGVHSISGSETLNARFPGQWFQRAGCVWASEGAKQKLRLALQLAPGLLLARLRHDTIPPSAATPSPTRSASSMGRACMLMRGMRRESWLILMGVWSGSGRFSRQRQFRRAHFRRRWHRPSPANPQVVQVREGRAVQPVLLDQAAVASRHHAPCSVKPRPAGLEMKSAKHASSASTDVSVAKLLAVVCLSPVTKREGVYR